MHNQRPQATVCFLLGPEQDRQDTHQFFEQSGYRVQIFKNPAVLFDYLQEFKPFVVVLDTAALRSKLSLWVSQLHAILFGQSWIALAPMDQYSILATYQSRGLVEIVDSKAPHAKERTLWALDRQLNVHLLSQRQQLEFVEEVKRQATPAPFVPQKGVTFTAGAMAIDDAKEIVEFWGPEVGDQCFDFLLQLAQERWGVQSVIKESQNIILHLNKPTSKVLRDFQELQNEVQTLGKQKFGFQMTVSAGISELSVHSTSVEDSIQQARTGCLKMQSKGGGRVAVPKPLNEEKSGDLPQDVG